ncbi:hypothetical protein GOA97_19405 [Sinorhizobium meliloti]|nr:hypothetical protein [Sinorhizobium meliloti]MDW9656623.1 hypothetical protein [Sinorhizobium meliloti]MDW9916433.1 hypothetical protein [Sinorhizobium meliloti]MDW9939578.1 hypothetical protein [Sinorhizobium meliloti]MDW9945965.1 hypothetical protein [Sinorhizobium meliloti]
MAEDLKRRLRAALKHEEDDYDMPERSQVRKSLSAVLDHLRVCGLDLELRAPLIHLYSALEDISEGRTNPLLEPAKMETGTSKKKTFDTLQWSMAAAAVTILMNEEKCDLTTAIKHVARPMGLETEQLKEFRKNVMKGKTSESARSNYDRFISDRRHYKDLPAKDFVEIMISKGRALSLQKG